MHTHTHNGSTSPRLRRVFNGTRAHKRLHAHTHARTLGCTSDKATKQQRTDYKARYAGSSFHSCVFPSPFFVVRLLVRMKCQPATYTSAENQKPSTTEAQVGMPTHGSAPLPHHPQWQQNWRGRAIIKTHTHFSLFFLLEKQPGTHGKRRASERQKDLPTDELASASMSPCPCPRPCVCVRAFACAEPLVSKHAFIDTSGLQHTQGEISVDNLQQTRLH